MTQEDPKPWVEWLELARAQVPVLRERYNRWREAVRKEPMLVWQTPGVRYGVYGLGGLLLLWITSGLLGMLTPPAPPEAAETARTADYHVVCTSEQCEYHFVINRRFGFRQFPVVCPKCQQKTGAQARRCNSATCMGRWVAPQEVDGTLRCPRCGRAFE